MSTRAHPRSQIAWAPSTKHSIARKRKMEAAGVDTLVDAGPVRAHVLELLGFGMNPRMIAWQAGVPDTTVRSIRDGVHQQTRVWVAERLTRVQPLPHPNQRTVLTIGALRRTRALQALGWSARDIGDRIGMEATALTALQRRTRIDNATWARIRDVYEALSATPGPSKIARASAARKGWLNPFEWEGYNIDDPRVTPPRSARTTADRSGARADRLGQVAELTAQGMSASAIADQLGVSERQIQRDRSAA
ncbi:helix-turn-helix domain-containing protein [Prescottella equi]|uniref:Uncharacterized protein n=1 Tax=Prescottella equi ATCC 33707 TaxID=525370 RepID=E9T0J3_RHOHA|nr:helix-turn-helix domain-containing protein [Prescottella equi]EGD23944.1 hypothetical protein HMPREF0724_12152 [Prescottella equi ATCC 33707]